MLCLIRPYDYTFRDSCTPCGGTLSPTRRDVQAKRTQNLVREGEVVPAQDMVVSEARDKAVRFANNDKMEGILCRNNSGFIQESSRQL